MKEVFLLWHPPLLLLPIETELISERFHDLRLPPVPPLPGSHSLRPNPWRTRRLFQKVQGSVKKIPRRSSPLLFPVALLFLLRGKVPLPVPGRRGSLWEFPPPFP